MGLAGTGFNALVDLMGIPFLGDLAATLALPEEVLALGAGGSLAGFRAPLAATCAPLDAFGAGFFGAALAFGRVGAFLPAIGFALGLAAGALALEALEGFDAGETFLGEPLDLDLDAIGG